MTAKYTYRLDLTIDSRPYYRPSSHYQTLDRAMQELTDLPAYDNITLTNTITGDILIEYHRYQEAEIDDIMAGLIIHDTNDRY